MLVGELIYCIAFPESFDELYGSDSSQASWIKYAIQGHFRLTSFIRGAKQIDASNLYKYQQVAKSWSDQDKDFIFFTLLYNFHMSRHFPFSLTHT